MSTTSMGASAQISAFNLDNTAIRQFDGLFSLNDLHKAAGGEAKHQPALFVRLEATQALAAEIHSTDSQSAISTDSQSLKTVNGGPLRGTYACRELVIAYAAWISPAFHLKVIRTFLAVTAPALPAPDQPSADQIESATSLAFIIAGQVAIDVQKAVLAGGDKWKHQRWSLSFITDSKFGSPPVVERLPADLRTLEQLHTAVAQGLLTHQDLLDLALVTTTQLCKSTTTKPKGFGDEVARQINQDLPLADLHTIATQANLELLLRVAGQHHSAGVPAPRPCSALNYSSARLQTTPRQKVLEFIAQAGPAGVSRRKLVHGCRAYLGLSHPQRALLLQELLQSQAIYTKPTPTGRSEVLVCAAHLVTA